MEEIINVKGKDIVLNIFRIDWEEISVYFTYKFNTVEKVFYCDADDTNLNIGDLLDWYDVHDWVASEICDIDYEY